MKKVLPFLVLIILSSAFHTSAQRRQPLPGVPAEIQLTPYKTTMIADGKDEAIISVKIIDVTGKEVSGSRKKISFHIKGDAHIVKLNGGDNHIELSSDTLWIALITGHCDLILRTGTTKSVIKFVAKADSLWDGSTDIHSVFNEPAHKVTTKIYKPKRVKDKILGADISFLPELEAKGMKFYDKGVEKDAIEILKEHGFNYIRLRIFNQPANPEGYSPGKGFCDLEHTKQMAKRVKTAHMKLLLDFHYSDYWADPGHQIKPLEWVNKDFNSMKTALHDYTLEVMRALKEQGTLPDMVQVGNEINHGMVWPEGQISHMDSLAQLLYEGLKAVKETDPRITTMLHIALGGQNAESRFFLDNMKARNVPFDVIGLSYYPKWHGTLADLKLNMDDLAKRYHKQVMVAEYTQLKQEVNDIAFNVTDHQGIGTFIWEPLSTWEMIFDRKGNTNDLISVYPLIAKKYNIK